jgi:hypothetical protein
MREDDINRAKEIQIELTELRAKARVLSHPECLFHIESRETRESKYFLKEYMPKWFHDVTRLLILEETKRRIAALEAELETL